MRIRKCMGVRTWYAQRSDQSGKTRITAKIGTRTEMMVAQTRARDQLLRLNETNTSYCTTHAPIRLRSAAIVDNVAGAKRFRCHCGLPGGATGSRANSFSRAWPALQNISGESSRYLHPFSRHEAKIDLGPEIGYVRFWSRNRLCAAFPPELVGRLA